MAEVDSARGLSVKRSRTKQDVVEPRELVTTGRQPDKRRRQADAYLNFATNKKILKRHAQWRDKGMQLSWITLSALLDGAIDVATSAKAAVE